MACWAVQRPARWRAVGVGACTVVAALWTTPGLAASPGPVVVTMGATLPMAAHSPVASLSPVAATSVVAAASPAAAACAGVSVVVDFGALGAPAVRGCVTLESQSAVSGVDALVAAGLSIEGTAQWGTAFICRVDGRPGAEEDIPLPDGQTLRESCARTPSQQAYWSLWHADGTEWRYATTGASDLDLGAGDVVALVFTTGPEVATAPDALPAQARSGELPSGWTDLATGTASHVEDAQTSTPGPDASSPTTATSSDSQEVGPAAPTSAADSTTSTGVGLVPVAALVLVLLGGAGAAVVARRRR